jgi:hypothetical protein
LEHNIKITTRYLDGVTYYSPVLKTTRGGFNICGKCGKVIQENQMAVFVVMPPGFYTAMHADCNKIQRFLAKKKLKYVNKAWTNN